MSIEDDDVGSSRWYWFEPMEDSIISTCIREKFDCDADGTTTI